jgi:hypothetical protein
VLGPKVLCCGLRACHGLAVTAKPWPCNPCCRGIYVALKIPCRLKLVKLLYELGFVRRDICQDSRSKPHSRDACFVSIPITPGGHHEGCPVSSSCRSSYPAVLTFEFASQPSYRYVICLAKRTSVSGLHPQSSSCMLIGLRCTPL